MITQLGVLYLTLLIGFLAFRKSFARVLALSAATPIGIAAAVGGEGIPVFYLFAAMAAGVILARTLKRSLSRGAVRDAPGRTALILFGVYAVLITALAPAVFEGVAVLAPREGIDSQVLAPSDLEYTISNLAQAGYLVLGIIVVFFLARDQVTSPTLLAWPLAGFLLLSAWRYVSLNTAIPFPEGFFDNSSGVRIIESDGGGASRFRGIAAEPSSVGYIAVVALAYFLWLGVGLRGARRVGALALALVAATLGILSTSTLFVAASAALVTLAVFAALTRFITGAKLHPGALLMGIAAFVATVPFAGAALDLAWRTLAEKTDSASFWARTSSDMFSVGVAAQTWLLGAGLGSNRPSSFAAMLLSTVGVIGVLLFVWAVARIAYCAWKAEEYRPVVVALVAMMIAKGIGGPSLSDPLLWITLGTLAAAAWEGRGSTHPRRQRPVTEEARMPVGRRSPG